jgi:DNA modification methylase
MKFKLYQGDCLERLSQLPRVKCIFADPPDNIGLGYDEYSDKRADADYRDMLGLWLDMFIAKADIVWISFNAKWTFTMGRLFEGAAARHDLEAKACTQVFTFGQHNKNDLGNNHRPLWRIMRKRRQAVPRRHQGAVLAATERRQAGGGRRPGARRCLRHAVSLWPAVSSG